MEPAVRTVPFYFDFISPYAYLAWKAAPGAIEARGAVLDPRPILFAALLDHHGNVGPAEIAAKRAYTFKDVVRRAARLGVPLAPPGSHPFRPLLALRLATASVDGVARGAVIDALFAAAWGGGRCAMDDPAAVRAALESADLPADALLEAAAGPSVKQALRAQTEAAIAAGVFDVPTFEVRGEIFWGQDAIPFVADALGGLDPARDLGGMFADLPATARRANAPE
jgi:2-hydroxychromene-2-carboxylate isomerase